MTRAQPTFAKSWRFDSGHVCAMTFSTDFTSWRLAAMTAERWHRLGFCRYDEVCLVLSEVRDVRLAWKLGAKLTNAE